MHFVKTNVFSRKFTEINSKSKTFLWNKRLAEIFILKTLHPIAYLRPRHRWSLAVIYKKGLTLQLLFLFIKAPTIFLRLHFYVLIVLSGCKGLQMSFWSEEISFSLARDRSKIIYSLEKRCQKFSDSSALYMASDMSQVHSIRPLIRLKCARIRLWSYLSDQSHLWSDLKDPNDLWPELSVQIDFWSDLNQTMAQDIFRSKCCPGPVFLGVRSSDSDHSSYWDWTSTRAMNSEGVKPRKDRKLLCYCICQTVNR